MSSTLSNGLDMIVQNPTNNPPPCDIVSEADDKFPQPTPKVTITIEEEEPPVAPDNRQHEFKSVYGESDLMSILEDRNGWDKEPSEVDGKYKSVKRCFNEKCQSTTALRKVRSRAVGSRYRNFCKPCHQSYTNNQFCEFCEQVYGNQVFSQQDDNNWIGCDSCDRWNHVSCEVQKRNKNAHLMKQQNIQYFCKQCADEQEQRKNENKAESINETKKQKVSVHQDDYYHYQRPVKKRTARQIFVQEKDKEYSNPNPNSVNVFGRPYEGVCYLDVFLYQQSSYRLAISDYEIREDLRKIKDGSFKEKREYTKMGR